ncbi:hypothetical protein MF406_17590 [Georgenia sp. TF02-10]|uniref:hypothetical protein n=1 Tax=Georgenia sp. TF02-10 TaxID=2917725 RepID=UPI001FA711A2|nr:hypothetical protein [Georgenia sp. TF02-10]UNX54663.1 hypothetical protein MF406_17590 [Georgenia sp. TF02-10]
MADLGAARTAKARLRVALAGRDGVRGVGIARTEEGYRLQVNVRREDDRTGVPAEVDGVPVTVRVTGTIRAGG